MSDAGEHTPRAVAIIPESQRSTNERYRFSAAIRSGEVLRCSGQIGNAADGSLATDPRRSSSRPSPTWPTSSPRPAAAGPTWWR